MDQSINQSTYDFLESLQLEYLCYEFRTKIYLHRKDRDYCRKVMGYKRDKIIDIANKKKIPTIFDNPNEELRLKNTLGITGSFPDFSKITYKSNELKKEFDEKDFEGFYNKKSDFKFYDPSKSKYVSCKILELHKDSNIAKIQIKGEIGKFIEIQLLIKLI